MATSVGRSVAGRTIGRRGVNQSDGRSIGRLVEPVRRSVRPTITHCPQLTIRYPYPRYPLVEPLSNTSFSCSYPRSLSFLLSSFLPSFLHLPRLLLTRYPQPTTSRSIRYTLPTVQLLITQYRLSTIIQFPLADTPHPLSTTHTPLLLNHRALRITHHLLRTAHYPVPTTHYSLAFTYLALLPFSSLLVHSKHSFAAPPIAGVKKKFPPLRPAPPSAARPRRERQ